MQVEAPLWGAGSEARSSAGKMTETGYDCKALWSLATQEMNAVLAVSSLFLFSFDRGRCNMLIDNFVSSFIDLSFLHITSVILVGKYHILSMSTGLSSQNPELFSDLGS